MPRTRTRKRPAAKPHWMRLRRLSAVPRRWHECRKELSRGDLVYWKPELRIPSHPGWLWCDAPECGGVIYQRLEKPDGPRHHDNN